MRYSRSSRNSDTGLFGGAGWLFADLMLAVVVVVFLATMIEPAESAPPRPPRPSVTTVTVTPSTTVAPPPPERLNPTPIRLDVELDGQALIAGDPGTIGALQASMRERLLPLLAGRRAGLVSTFGSSTVANIQRGILVANRFNDLVLRGLGDQFRDSAFEGYFQGNGPSLRMVTFKIYVFER